ncbi:hypothetical protein GW742_10060 [Citrobacter freundii]|nr:hypothetical protein [Citrobacter freundii]MBC6506688.1 hypothetical protein [Citrobacter freundii]
MLFPELHAVILAHIRASALSKAAHVQYTAQKCFRLRERMLVSAAVCREDAQTLSLVLNRQYRLVKYLSKHDDDGSRDTGHKPLLKLTREQYDQTGRIQVQLSGVAGELTVSADSLLFTLLKAQHYQWRDRLYVAILTAQVEEMMIDESECTLTRWIQGEGMQRFQSLQGFRALEACHRRVHDVSRGLFERKLASFSPQTLRDTLHRTEEASQQLIVALDSLDEQVGRSRPSGIQSG